MKKKEKDMTMAEFIRGFDFYKDLPKDLQEPSVSGASGMYWFVNSNLVSMIAMGLMALMFIS